MNVFWLNLDQARTGLNEAVSRLAEKHPEIEQIWLFGSLARGDAVPGSDADILIVLRESLLPFLDRAVHYRPDGCGLSVDVLAYTQAELEQMRVAENPFLAQIEGEAVSLFQRN